MPDIDLDLYKRAFRHTENPMLVTDENYIIRDVNRACISFTGYSRAELIGDLPLKLFPDPAVYEDLVEKLEDDEPWQGYFQTQTKGGYQIYGQGSAIPLIINGEKRGYSGIFVDLTERRQYEKALQVMYRVLRHDLKNEMNLILGYLETLEAELPKKSHERIETVESLGQRLIRRADKARSLEQLLYGGFEQPNRSVVLDTVLERGLDNIRQRFPTANLSVGPIPSCTVIANELLETVIESLVENAIIHNAEPPRITVIVEEDDRTVTVRVADDGRGIDDRQKQHLFGREEKDELRHGDGFSLYFVDCVMELYRGSITVSDNEFGGATFELTLLKA